MKDENINIPRELTSPSDSFMESSARIGIHWWHWDNLEKKLIMSPSLLQLLGYTEEEYDPSNPGIYKNIHPNDIQDNANRIRRLIYGEDELYEIEYRIRDNSGEWKWLYNRGNVLSRDEKGKGTAVGGITMDMPGKYRQLISQVEEKERFEFIFRNTSEAVIIFELEEKNSVKVLDANTAALDLFGEGPENLNMSIPSVLSEDDLSGETGILLQQVLEKGYGQVETKIKSENRELWLDISAHAFTRAGEQLMIAICNDKTGRKKAEAAQKESELLYRTLFEAADDAIGLFSVEREVILINSAFSRTFGYSSEEFLKLGWSEVFHPEDWLKFDAMQMELVQKGTLSSEYRVRHKSGEYIFVSSKSVLIPNESKGSDMILIIIRDVTEWKVAIKELELAKEKAEESDMLKSAFLANMSHEIRTPMNSIVGFSNLLVNPGLDEEARELYVERIVRNSEQLLTLISDIVDLAKIESHQLPLIYGKQKLSVLLEEMKLYGEDEIVRLKKTGIEIITEETGDECEIETDVIRISQVMKNLVNNAIKFTESGKVRIGCKASDSEKKVILFVEDSGVGISSDNFHVIFDQFRQIDGSNTRKFGGTGLGLAICKNLVQMMGGRIWVESTEKMGSLFQVELPRKAFRTDAFPISKKLESSNVSKPERNLRIIVVDDEQDSLELFFEILSGMGHDVVKATSGYEALRLMEKEQLPDLVFMDDRMAVMSGTETMRIIKDRYCTVKVVAQSAHALVGDRARYLKQGFDEYLPKPFTREQLMHILSTLSGD